MVLVHNGGMFDRNKYPGIESHSDRKALGFFHKYFPTFYGIKLGKYIKGFFAIVVLSAVLTGFVVLGNVIYDAMFGWTEITYDESGNVISDSESGDCNVVGINLHGELLTYIPENSENDSFFDHDVSASEEIVWNIIGANDNTIKAVIVEVDSSGGSPVAGEEIADAIKNSEIPVVAMIRQIGASASYWAISSADKIFASKNSDVGGIGVTQSYIQNVGNNKKEGYEFIPLSTGKFKDTGNPDKPITAEDKELLMRDLKIVYQNFIETISENRNIPIEKVEQMADGSTVLGKKAKELGLIDEIGGMIEVKAYLGEIIGEKPNICW